jgi:hypothetical protein
MFDHNHNFGIQVPLLAQSSIALTYAMLAISARQMEREKKLSGEHSSLQLYQEAIKSLTPQLLACEPPALATCVILCCLEMMSASPKSWRKHLDGCAALFESHGITGFSGGLAQAVFWCYARMGIITVMISFLPNYTDLSKIDLCSTIISEGDHSVVLPLQHWIPPDVFFDQVGELFRSTGDPDMWANYAVFLTARVCDFIWSHTKDTGEDGPQVDHLSYLQHWLELWTELQTWHKDRPPALLPLEYAEETGEYQSEPFPFILFAAPCAISSNQLYHAGCLLLLEVQPPSINLAHMGPASLNLWHARRICGISMTNEHHGCLNNAIQPLWIAGRLLSHPTEHRAIVNLIKRIEVLTGWGSRWRIVDLMKVWGYQPNETF